MSDQTTPTVEPSNVPQKARKPRQKRESYDVTAIARARLRKRGVKSDDRLGDEMKVTRGRLRSHWSELVKAAPKSYGPKGSIKRAPNDRRPWGPIPASVAKSIIEGQK